MIYVVGENKLLDSFLNFIVELETVAGKELDTIILKRIMGSRNDHTGIRSHTAGDKGYTRGRQWSNQEHVHSHGTDA